MKINEKLKARLITEGLAAEKAEEIAKSIDGYDDADDVDVEKLGKALKAVAEIAKGGAVTSQEDVDAALAEASNVVDAVTKGADAILAQSKEAYTTLAKGLLSVGKQMKKLRKAMKEQKSDLEKALKMPVSLPQAVQSTDPAANGVIRKAFEDGQPNSKLEKRDAIIRKAMSDMQDDNIKGNRKAELRRAVAQLESGYDPDQIGKAYNIAA